MTEQGKVIKPNEGQDVSEKREDQYGSTQEETWERLLEAVLFAASEPLSEKTLAAYLPQDVPVSPLLKKLQGFYKGRGVNLVSAGEAWAFRTAFDIAGQLQKETGKDRKLSRAAAETLAIIAYHQPVTRAEIEEIRGVQISKGTIDVLFEAEWIEMAGRRQTPGRPMIWRTTDGFLDHFGLETLDDLPGKDELKSAGLLDTRPAIDINRSIGSGGAKEETEEEEEKEEEEEEASSL